MKIDKNILLAVVGIAAVFSLLYGLMSQSGPRRSHAKLSSITTRQNSTTEVAAKRRARRTEYKTWSRSPFVATEREKQTGLVLNGILGSGGNLKAMIGDAIVKKGDKLGAYIVTDIRKDGVTLSDGEGKTELKLVQ